MQGKSVYDTPLWWGPSLDTAHSGSFSAPGCPKVLNTINLFPSPGALDLAPSDSSIPTIPSSLSPPNPDAMVAPGRFMPFQPSASFPIHFAIPLAWLLCAILVFVV
ncbi:putative beta-glucosidase 11-like [Capsicum annuum]|nr:putative beta-glucosidase 11-like [Capsicum annuum]